jgi:serine/threonine protein kinase
MSDTRRRAKVFVSYSHGDAVWLTRLRIHLRPLERTHDIEVWDDTRITPGSKWKEEIQKAIESATVAVLLVSADFLASDFIASDELPPLLKAAEDAGAIILPVILSPCRFESTKTLSGFQAVNPPTKPLINMTRGEQEETFVKVSGHIEASLNRNAGPESEGAADAIPTPMSPAESARGLAAALNTGPALSRYESLHTIYVGHYGRVRKCRIRETGEICIVKETRADRVCIDALHAIKELGCRSIATPRRIWKENGTVFEELPYVGGTRLSTAVAPGIGGLRGSVLENFHKGMLSVLRSLHDAGVVHRDIHPDNIYLVIRKPEPVSALGLHEGGEPWQYSVFGENDEQFLLAWVLVDCTFSTLLSRPGNNRYRHGSYTSGEQESGSAIPASDLYAFGATIFFGITGREVPSYQSRLADPELLAEFPSGGHSAINFPAHLRDLLSLNPPQRPSDSSRLQYGTTSYGYAGTLHIPDHTFLTADFFRSECRLRDPQDAIEFFEQRKILEKELYPEYFSEEDFREFEYWIKRANAAGADRHNFDGGNAARHRE